MEYVFDQKWSQELQRLTSMEKGEDPGTIRHIEEIGVQKTWRCLEIGGGGGSIARWLCKKAGHVVATDLETNFLETINEPNIEVWQHDISTDELEEESFDLVHVRAVLEFIPGREKSLKKIISAIKPGGWILLEAHDFFSSVPISNFGKDLFTRATGSILEIFTDNGFDITYGRMLGPKLREAGLMNVSIEGRSFELGGNRPLTLVWSLGFQQLKNRIAEKGLMSKEEVDEATSVVNHPDFCAISPTMVAARGQKPQ